MARAINLNSLRLPTAATLPGGDLLKRWREALLRCLPRRLRQYVVSRNPLLVVVPNGDDAELFRQLGDARDSIGGLDLRTGGQLSSMIAASPKHGWRDICLELPAPQVLHRNVLLPAQVKDNLRQVVSYEIDRLTPFQVADVLFDTRIDGILARGTKLQVNLAVCRRDQVTDWLERLREGGSPASRVSWVGAWPEANLLPPQERPRPRRFGSLMTWVLLASLFVLVLAVLVTPLWQRTEEQETLTRELRKVRIDAAEVDELRQALERARLGSVEVLQRKREQPRITDLLRELTDLLPDGTWVQTMNFRDGDVDIRGESSQATALIGLLEQGPGIKEVSFRSPVMQVAATGKERFHISFKYSRPDAQ
ncbi:MAG: PilN domain-containing protein [Thiohalocapsa sp.]